MKSTCCAKGPGVPVAAWTDPCLPRQPHAAVSPATVLSPRAAGEGGRDDDNLLYLQVIKILRGKQSLPKQ